MRYYCLLILFLSTCCTGIYAQLSPTLGKTTTISQKDVFFDSFIGASDDYLFYFLENYDGYVISIESISRDGLEHYSYGFDKLLPDDIYAYVADEHVHLWLTQSTSSALSLELIVLSSKLKSVQKTKQLSHTFKSATHKGGFVLNRSENNKLVGVLQEKPGDLSKSEDLNFVMFDIAGKKLWDATWDTQLKQTNKPANELAINNNGVAFVLKRHRQGREFYYHNYIFKQNESPKHIKSELQGLRISEIMQKCGSTGELILVGLYSETLYENNDGYFYRIMNEDGYIKMRINKKFDEAFMSIFIGKKAGKKDANIDHVDINWLNTRKDGFIFALTAETREVIKDKKGKFYDEKFINGPAYVQHFDYKGDLLAAQKILTTQETWNFQHAFASNACRGSDSTLIMYSDIVSDDKEKSIELPFNSSIFIEIPADSAENYSTHSIRIEGDNQIYPPSCAYTSDAKIIGILLNQDLTAIQPFVLEKK